MSCSKLFQCLISVVIIIICLNRLTTTFELYGLLPIVCLTHCNVFGIAQLGTTKFNYIF